MLGLIFLTAPNSAQAQLRYRTNNNTVTIIGYTGTDGDVTIPSTINGYPDINPMSIDPSSDSAGR